MTDRSSFEGLDSWLEKIRDQGPERLAICIIGNKIDLVDKREVSQEDIIAKAHLITASWQETSALEDRGIDVIYSV